jgi:glycosyltransferase involved in cell wall biosynthesis
MENLLTGITAHVIVKNEEKWIWYSIMSVINYVDKMIIFDTGSTDNTVKIIKEIVENYDKNNKIIFEQKIHVTKDNFSKLREEQIQRTETEWFLVLDGDEIWYSATIRELVAFSKKNTKYKLIALRFHNCVGDVYHYKNFESETYRIKDIVGSITIRAFSKRIEGINCGGEYGTEGYFDDQGNEVQNRRDEIYIQEGFYFHTSYLQRSSSLNRDWEIPYRRSKVFGRIEGKVSIDFDFPEVFYEKKRPDIVDDAFRRIGIIYFIFKLFAYFSRVLNLLKKFRKYKN